MKESDQKGNIYMVLLLLLSCFSCVQLCATPEMAAHQSPLSLGFSRQEHRSGLPFPSPMHESEKWKWSHLVVSDSLWPPWTAAHPAPPSMGFSRQEYWSGVPLPSPITNLESILKNRDITLSTKVRLVKAVFYSGPVWMWELDYKEGWVPKNWCFWTVVLEKTLESPLDCKESLSS